LWELCKDLDIVTDINMKRLAWIGHVVRMDHGIVVKKIYESTPEGRRRMGRSRLRWLEDVEKDPPEMKAKRWRHKAVDRRMDVCNLEDQGSQRAVEPWSNQVKRLSGGEVVEG
jgi:DNA-binding PadR family transcriptional regulator